MKGRIIITEENFEDILKQLQDICNKFRMIEVSKTLFKSETTKDFRENHKLEKDANGNISKFIRVSKHPFRYAYEEGKPKGYVDMYYNIKQLIHLDCGNSRAVLLCAGDKIQFLPFGGFVIWSNNRYVTFREISILYNNIYVPNKLSKIKDLKKENELRDNEWEDNSYLEDLNL